MMIDYKIVSTSLPEAKFRQPIAFVADPECRQILAYAAEQSAGHPVTPQNLLAGALQNPAIIELLENNGVQFDGGFGGCK